MKLIILESHMLEFPIFLAVKFVLSTIVLCLMGMAIPKISCHKDLTTKYIQKYANSIKPYNVLRFEFSAILFF